MFVKTAYPTELYGKRKENSSPLDGDNSSEKREKGTE